MLQLGNGSELDPLGMMKQVWIIEDVGNTQEQELKRQVILANRIKQEKQFAYISWILWYLQFSCQLCVNLSNVSIIVLLILTIKNLSLTDFFLGFVLGS